jgi:hypothetical protein
VLSETTYFFYRVDNNGFSTAKRRFGPPNARSGAFIAPKRIEYSETPFWPANDADNRIEYSE